MILHFKKQKSVKIVRHWYNLAEDRREWMKQEIACFQD